MTNIQFGGHVGHVNARICHRNFANCGPNDALMDALDKRSGAVLHKDGPVLALRLVKAGHVAKAYS